MPSDKDLIRDIETHATTLAQAVAAAEQYYKRYTAEIEHTLQERLAANQTEYDEAMDHIQQEHQQAVDAACQELQEVEQACGLWAAPWDDPAWEAFRPDQEAPVPYLTRLGKLQVTPSSGREKNIAIDPDTARKLDVQVTTVDRRRQK